MSNIRHKGTPGARPKILPLKDLNVMWSQVVLTGLDGGSARLALAMGTGISPVFSERVVRKGRFLLRCILRARIAKTERDRYLA